MSITLRDLLPRVMMYRPELDDAKGMFALTEAARRLGQTAAIFRYPSIHNAMTVGEREFVVGVDSEFKNTDGSLFRVENVAVADIPEGLTYAGPWDAATNTPYLGDPNATDMPASWREVDTAGDPAPDMQSPIGHVYGNKIMLYGKASNPNAGGAFRTAIKVYNTDTNKWNPIVLWIDEATYRQCSLSEVAVGVPYNPMIMSVRVHPVTPDGRAIIWGGLPPGSSSQLNSASWIYNFNSHSVQAGPIIPTNAPQQFTSSVYDIGSGQFFLFAGQGDAGSFGGSSVNIPYGIPFIWDYTQNTIDALPYIRQPFGSDRTVYWGLGVAGRKLYAFNRYLSGFVFHDVIFEWNIDTQEVVVKFDQPDDVANKSYTFYDAAHVHSGGFIYLIGGTYSGPSGTPDVLHRFNTATGSLEPLVQIPNSNGNGIAMFLNPINTDQIMIANLAALNEGQRVFGCYSISKNKFTNLPMNIFGQKITDALIMPFKDMVYAFRSSATTPASKHEAFSPFRPSNTGRYYTVSDHGTTDKSGITQWDKGDVIYNDGTSWYRIRLDKFVYIQQMNDPGLNNASATAEFGDGIPQSWWQRNGRVFWTVRPDRTYPVRLDLSYAPIGNEISSIDIPAECESVLVDGALSVLYSIPGQNMSPQLAAAADMRFKKGMATVRAIGMFGYGGTPKYYSGTAFGPQWNTIAVNWMER